MCVNEQSTYVCIYMDPVSSIRFTFRAFLTNNHQRRDHHFFFLLLCTKTIVLFGVAFFVIYFVHWAQYLYIKSFHNCGLVVVIYIFIRNYLLHIYLLFFFGFLKIFLIWKSSAQFNILNCAMGFFLCFWDLHIKMYLVKLQRFGGLSVESWW